jgi:hypothetical protein
VEGDDIRIPTLPVEVAVRTSRGDSRRVTIFLSRTSSFHEGPETLDEFLNAPRPFLPAQSADGLSYLVGREAVVCVSASSSAPVLSKMPGRVASSIHFVRLLLEDGTEVEGTMAANLPLAHSRVSDAFNQADTFVPIESADLVIYVRRSKIAEVRFS